MYALRDNEIIRVRGEWKRVARATPPYSRRQRDTCVRDYVSFRPRVTYGFRHARGSVQRTTAIATWTVRHGGVQHNNSSVNKRIRSHEPRIPKPFAILSCGYCVVPAVRERRDRNRIFRFTRSGLGRCFDDGTTACPRCASIVVTVRCENVDPYERRVPPSP